MGNVFSRRKRQSTKIYQTEGEDIVKDTASSKAITTSSTSLGEQCGVTSTFIAPEPQVGEAASSSESTRGVEKDVDLSSIQEEMYDNETVLL